MNHGGWTESDRNAKARLARRDALHKQIMAEREAAKEQEPIRTPVAS